MNKNKIREALADVFKLKREQLEEMGFDEDRYLDDSQEDDRVTTDPEPNRKTCLPPEQPEQPEQLSLDQRCWVALYYGAPILTVGRGL